MLKLMVRTVEFSNLQINMLNVKFNKDIILIKLIILDLVDLNMNYLTLQIVYKILMNMLKMEH